MGGISTETFSLKLQSRKTRIYRIRTMNSPEKTSDATEEENMDVTENTCPESTSDSADMEASSSAEGNKNEAGKQAEVSNLRAAPPHVNQAKNMPPDNRTHVDKSEPKTKRTKQNTESGKGTTGLRAEKLMKCPKCEANIAPPSVTFCKQKNDQYAFNIDLQQDSGDDHKDRLDWTNKAVDKTTTKQCPECKESFPVMHSVVSRTNRKGGFDLEFSIDIKGDKLEGGTQSKNGNCDNKGTEQDDMDDSSSEQPTGGTQSRNRNCDNEWMEEDDRDASSSEMSTGRNTDKPFLSRLRDGFSNLTESKKFSSRKPEQSNQTTNSEGWSISSFFKPPTPVVKVYYTPTSDTFGADAAIMKQMKDNLRSSLLLEETTRRNCSVIIVFCPVSRSFESEIKSAMEKEAVSSSRKPVILVMMHHTRDHDYPTVGCDASEVLKNVFYVHVFYHDSANGLLRCKQNDTSIKAIERKLQTYQQ